MKIEAMKLALEALERYQVKRQDFDRFADEITALREALAEQPAQQEPEIEYCTNYHCAGDCGQPHNQKEMLEFLAAAPQPAQQEPVAWVTVEKGVCVSTRSANFKNVPDGQHQLYVGPLQNDVLAAISTLKSLGYVYNESKTCKEGEQWIAPQPAQQEPVAWVTQARNFVDLTEFTEAEAKLYGWKAVYTSPPAQRTWVGLSDEEVQEIWDAFSSPASGNIVRNIEAKLKEKNT